MLVVGYKANTNFTEVTRVIKKHCNFSASDVKHIVEHIKEGNVVKLPDDFVLREDLEDLNVKLD